MSVPVTVYVCVCVTGRLGSQQPHSTGAGGPRQPMCGHVGVWAAPGYFALP